MLEAFRDTQIWKMLIIGDSDCFLLCKKQLKQTSLTGFHLILSFDIWYKYSQYGRWVLQHLIAIDTWQQNAICIQIGYPKGTIWSWVCFYT